MHTNNLQPRIGRPTHTQAEERRWLDVCDRVIGDALIGVMLLLSIVLCLGAV
jgi:hypothetical protein